jgi:hypothetical protein
MTVVQLLPDDADTGPDFLRNDDGSVNALVRIEIFQYRGGWGWLHKHPGLKDCVVGPFPTERAPIAT